MDVEFLDVKNPRKSTFYPLPKLHKDTKNPPEHLIVSGVGNLTEAASQLVDQILKPHVNSLASHVKDTIHLLQQLEGMCVPSSALLVALAVESLYCIIPHSKGLDVVAYFFVKS